MDFDTLYRRYARDVHRFALFLCGNASDADDITAETFVRAWTARAPIRVGSVKAYLFMIARRLHAAGRRRAARHVALEDHPAADRDPETAAALRGDLQRVMNAMQTLSEIDRAALLMRVDDEMPYEEIAAALGISLSSAKVKVHRARARLLAIREGKDTP